MDTNICAHCAYFRQHYILRDGRLSKVYCGHCTLRKPKRKKPDAAACEQFSTAPADEDDFVSKDYLTKTLLHHLLRLELLPPIENTED